MYINILAYILFQLIFMGSIIIDTSSIIFGLSNNIDIFDTVAYELPGYKILISKGIVEELKKLGSKNGRYKKYAHVALTLIKKHKAKVANSSSYVDAWIENEAVKTNCTVCTNDIKLKKLLKSKDITVLSISRSGLLR